MKSLFSTTWFLVEDIVRRWIENPLSPLAKMTITLVLVTIASTVLLSFHVSEKAIEDQIVRFGASSLVLREHHSNVNQRQRSTRMVDFLRARPDVDIVSVVAVPTTARTEFRTTAQVLTTLEGLPGNTLNQVPTLYSDAYTAGVRTAVFVQGNRIPVVTQAAPDWLKRIASGDVVHLPYSLVHEAVDQAYEVISVVEVKGGPTVAATLAASIQSLIELEDRQRTRLFSPESLFNELEQLRRDQSLWQLAIVWGMGLAMAIVLSVISLMEYKQREFYAALLRSLGMHAGLIYLRYLVEALIPTFLIAGVALYLVVSMSSAVLPSIGVELSALGSLDLDTFVAEEGIYLAAFLILGSFIGSLPVAVLLRKPVGKVMA